jgi:hypothetical protein
LIEVLGFELSRAVMILEQAGYEVTTGEVRSRKGLMGNERRVVRQQAMPSNADGQPRIRLTYAVFCTQVAE